MSEQQIQKKIIDLVEARGGYAVKVITASRSGIPDLLICFDGMFIGLEVKMPSTRTNVSKLQQYNLQKIIDSGGRSAVVWSPEQVDELLDLL